MLNADRIDAPPPLNLSSTTIQFSELFTEREKPLLIEMGALAFGATVVAGLALAGVTVLLAPEILATACIVGGIALFVLGIKIPAKFITKWKTILLEKKVVQLVNAAKQQNVNINDFDKIYSLITNLMIRCSNSSAQDKLKNSTTFVLILKYIVKAQEHLKPAGDHLLAIHFLAQASHELNNSQSMDAALKNDLFTYISMISNQMTPLIKRKIIQTIEGIPLEAEREVAQKEIDSVLEDTFRIRPTSIAELIRHIQQQRIIFDLLKCIKVGQKIVFKSKNTLLTDAETRRALIYVSDAEKELKTPSLHRFSELLLPIVTELKEAISTIRFSNAPSSSEESKRIANATIVQRRWRSRLRRRLLQNNQTFEDYRIKAADKETLATIPAALKRKAMFSNTHIVFTHGQSSKVSVLNDLVKALTKKFSPEKYRPYASGFRIPELVPRADNVEEFFKRYPNNFVDDHINNELLSVDAFFNNHDLSESAQYFYSQNLNISMTVQPRAVTILQHFLTQSSICETLAQKVETIASRKQSDGKGGVFHTICVPKVIVNNPKRNYAYRCHPYGKTCGCHPKEQEAKILDDLQKDIPHPCGSKNPQYRLVTSAFSRDTSVRSFAFSNRTKAKEEEYLKEIENVALELHVYARLINLAAPPLDAELANLTRDIQTLIALPNFNRSTLDPLLVQKQAFVQIAL